MIENWYLADIEHISKEKVFVRDNVKQRNFEGSQGKAEIKRLMAKGHTYRETFHGPAMFAILRFDSARQQSASLDRFLSIVQPFLGTQPGAR